MEQGKRDTDSSLPLPPELSEPGCVGQRNCSDCIFIILKIKVTRSSLSVLWVNELFLWVHRNARMDSEHLVSWKWQGCSPGGVGWPGWGCGKTAETGGSWEVWARAAGSGLPPSSLEALQLGLLMQRPWLFLFLKAFLTCTFPWGADSLFCREFVPCFPERKKGVGMEGLKGISEWARLGCQRNESLHVW